MIVPPVSILVIVLLANLVETVAGFGSTLLVLVLGGFWYPIPELVLKLVPLNLILSAYLVIRYFRSVDHRILWRRIFPGALLGFPIGAWAYHQTGTPEIEVLFGTFLLFYSARQIRQFFKESSRIAPSSRPITDFAWLVAGGFMQGLTGSGGPMIVAYTRKFIVDRNAFRATLSVLWLVLNLILTVSYLATAKLSASDLESVALWIPSVVLGIALGERVHQKLNQRQFQLFVLVLLLLGALLTLYRHSPLSNH